MGVVGGGSVQQKRKESLRSQGLSTLEREAVILQVSRVKQRRQSQQWGEPEAGAHLVPF